MDEPVIGETRASCRVSVQEVSVPVRVSGIF